MISSGQRGQYSNAVSVSKSCLSCKIGLCALGACFCLKTRHTSEKTRGDPVSDQQNQLNRRIKAERLQNTPGSSLKRRGSGCSLSERAFRRFTVFLHPETFTSVCLLKANAAPALLQPLNMMENYCVIFCVLDRTHHM